MLHLLLLLGRGCSQASWARPPQKGNTCHGVQSHLNFPVHESIHSPALLPALIGNWPPNTAQTNLNPPKKAISFHKQFAFPGPCAAVWVSQCRVVALTENGKKKAEKPGLEKLKRLQGKVHGSIRESLWVLLPGKRKQA